MWPESAGEGALVDVVDEGRLASVVVAASPKPASAERLFQLRVGATVVVVFEQPSTKQLVPAGLICADREDVDGTTPAQPGRPRSPISTPRRMAAQNRSSGSPSSMLFSAAD